jgi:NADH-quinone oxidoreductase subunit G
LRDIITAAARVGGREWETLDDVIASLAVTMPEFSAVPDIAPPAGFRIAGMRIPRQPHRYSGRTAMFANKTVFEPKPPKDRDSPLAFSMEGYPGQPPSPFIPEFWAPGWNSPQAMNKFQSEVGGTLRGGDPGRRLIEPLLGGNIPYFKDVPSAFAPRRDSLLFVPAYHIFGSEERSMLSPGIAELSPRPYVGLNHQQMRDQNLAEGEEVLLKVNRTSFLVPVKQMTGLPAGLAALPPGLPEAGVGALPAWGTVSKQAKRSEVT